MPTVELEEQEWAQLMFVLANAEGKGITWGMVNPLIMNIGNQLRLQKETVLRPPQPRPDGDGSKEVHRAQ